MTMCSTRSSLELMLDSIRQRDEQPPDLPPALPVRPVSRARLPPARRALPVTLRKGGLREDPTGNEGRKKEGTKSSFELGVLERERTKRESIAASMSMPMPAQASMGEFKCGGKVEFVLKKVELLDILDDTKERAIERILEIQKHFRAHLARCYYLELKQGTITLQSFVRGEKARKDYHVLTRKLKAIIAIQQHTKRWITWRTMQERQRAVICVQSGKILLGIQSLWLCNHTLNFHSLITAVIRGRLARRCLNHKRNCKLAGTEDMINPVRRKSEIKDYIQVPSSALAELQRRLLWVEAELGHKEEENSALRQQVQQFDRRWSEYEAKMKHMEKMWQDQLASLQVSLAAAHKSLAPEWTTTHPENIDSSPLTHRYNADDAPSGKLAANVSSTEDLSDMPHDTEPQQINSKSNDIRHLSEQPKKKVFHGNSCNLTPNDELRKLKLRFEMWKKDYKVRLQETQTMVQKLGNSEIKKSRMKWWGR